MKISEFFKKHINKRRLKYGSFATALTVFVIAAIVLVNVVATLLFDRFPITLDLTSGGIYTVSEESAEYISGIESPVAITVLSTEEDYRVISDYTAQTVELLKNYTQQNRNISVKYIDLLSSPDFVASYSQSLASGDIIVELDNGEHSRVKIVTLADILNVPDDYATYLAQMKTAYGAEYAHRYFTAAADARQVTLKSNAEQAITSAIMTVTESNPITVAVLTYPGADEADASGLTDLLSINGYIITSVDIQGSELDDDIDIAVIPAPKVDYTVSEISKLEDWLQGGGMLGKHIIYIASAMQPETPNLDGLLYKYGITVERALISETDTDKLVGGENAPRSYTLQTIATDNYLTDVTNRDRMILAPDARAITTRFDDVDAIYACETLITSSASCELRPLSGDANAEVTERGSFASAVLAKQQKINQDTHISTYTYILAIGSELMIEPSVIRSANYNNGDFIISMLNELTGKSEGITITPKSVSAGNFEITTSQTRALTLTFALIIPVAVLAVGTFVWVRRRHK